MKIAQRVSELLSGHEIRTDGQTGGQTDGKVITIMPLPISSDGALISCCCCIVVLRPR